MGEILSELADTGDKLDLLRMLLPRESSADVEIANPWKLTATPEELAECEEKWGAWLRAT